MTITPTATGAVLPPGSVPASNTLPEGPVVITIESAVGENDGLFIRDDNGELVLENGEPVPAPSEYIMVRCVYPNEFVKNHQVKDVADLAPRVIGVIRGCYGVTGDIDITKLPASLVAGETIELEV